MKKIIILISGILIVACSSDFTDLIPISDRNVDNFFTNTNDFIVTINGSYRELQDEGVYGRAYWILFEMRGDNTDQGPDQTGLAAQFTQINRFTEASLNEPITDAWIASYRVIANANRVLDNIDNIEIETSLKNRLIGEALFMRSLMYYHLAIAYGNIPLELTTLALGQESTQVDANTVYNQLVIDLQTAETNLQISYTGDDIGRATKGAAATLLAKVLLTMGNVNDAETVLRRIINTYGYNLETNYANLWGETNENNVESIFEVQYISGGVNQGSAFTNDFSPDASLQTGSGFGRNRPTTTMESAYEVGDLRFNPSMGTTWDRYEDGVFVETVNQRYIKKYNSNPASDGDSGINFIVFRYADVLLMLAEALGETSESYDLINQVRTRAGLPDIDALTPGTFEEKLLHERQVELAFENHRWSDLLRFGVAAQVVSDAEPDVNLGDVKTLYPIPQRELDVNPNFVQN